MPKSNGAQNLRGMSPRAEQILRSEGVKCEELGGILGWHIGCIRWLPAARNGAHKRL
jgi:hypothetical protein